MNDDYAAEPASEPVAFPEARMRYAVRFQCQVYDPSKQQYVVADNVIRPTRDSGVSTGDPQVAYMIVKKIQKAMIFHNEHSGMVYRARVLNRRIGEENDLSHYAQWELTDQEVAIKELDMTRVFLNENHKQAVKNEVKAMRYIQNYANAIQNLNHAHAICGW